MFQIKNYQIKSCDDIELDIKRENLLDFKLAFNDAKTMNGFFFFIPGLGDDNNENYQEKIAEWIVEEFQMAVFLVQYHCIGNRPLTGATWYLDDIDKMILKETCKALGIELPEFLLPSGNIDEVEKIDALLSFINTNIENLKAQSKIKPEFRLPIHASLKPPKNEYQNFGLMQAMDCLNALFYIKQNPPFKLAKNYRTIMMGSSHGGYIAHLAAKYAPWAIDGVLDNSSYAQVVPRLVGFGKEIDYTTQAEFAAFNLFPQLIIYGSTKTFFTSNKNSKNYFSPSFTRIRNPYDEEHLKVQANYHKINFISYHSTKDLLAPIQPKIALYENLKQNGFDATLNIIENESDVDGKFIKNLNHGMDMSLKTLIQKELPLLISKKIDNDKKDIKESIYQCENLSYHFKEVDKEGRIDLTIKRV